MNRVQVFFKLIICMNIRELKNRKIEHKNYGLSELLNYIRYDGNF